MIFVGYPTRLNIIEIYIRGSASHYLWTRAVSHMIYISFLRSTPKVLTLRNNPSSFRTNLVPLHRTTILGNATGCAHSSSRGW